MPIYAHQELFSCRNVNYVELTLLSTFFEAQNYIIMEKLSQELIGKILYYLPTLSAGKAASVFRLKHNPKQATFMRASQTKGVPVCLRPDYHMLDRKPEIVRVSCPQGDL